MPSDVGPGETEGRLTPMVKQRVASRCVESAWIALMDSFLWSGADEGDDEPDWIILAIADGRAEIENDGTPAASLVIGTRHFPRGSTIRHEDIED